jgi:hypothetical protein
MNVNKIHFTAIILHDFNRKTVSCHQIVKVFLKFKEMNQKGRIGFFRKKR